MWIVVNNLFVKIYRLKYKQYNERRISDGHREETFDRQALTHQPSSIRSLRCGNAMLRALL